MSRLTRWFLAGSVGVVGMHVAVRAGWIVGAESILTYMVAEAIVLLFAVAAACAWRARRSPGRLGLGWGLIAVGVTCALAANVTWNVYPWLAGIDELPFPNVADWLSLLTLPLLTAGVVLLPVWRGRSLGVFRAILDGVTITGTVVAVGWVTVLGPLFALNAGFSGAEQFFNASTPVMDVVMVSVLGLMAARSVSGRGMILALTIGLAITAFGDLLTTWLWITGRLTDAMPTELFGMAGLAVIGFAALRPATALSLASPTRTVGRVSASLPYAAGAVTLVTVVFFRATSGPVDGPLFASMAVVFAAVLVRQFLALRENARLSRGLEAAVRERTADLEIERGRVADHARELGAFRDVVLAGVSGTGLEQTADKMMSTMASALGYDGAVLALVEEIADVTVLRRIAGVGIAGAPSTHDLERTIEGHVHASGIGMRISDLARAGAGEHLLGPMRSALFVPLRAGEHVAGVVAVGRAAPDAFGESDLEQLNRLAPQLGLIISNARLYEQEHDTVARLEELGHMRSEFVAVTSHELRTPLTSIIGFVETIRTERDSLTPEETDQFLEIVHRQSHKLAGLVEELLLVSRLEAGTVTVQPESTQLDQLVAATLEQLGAGADRVALEVDPDLPPFPTDPARLGQVLRNLLENGLKFSPDIAKVVLRARVEDQELRIEVADRGIGIASDHLERVFEPFFQAEDSDRRNTGGFGLGLYISQQLVQALGGSIEVDSVLGRGTTFVIRLALEPAAVAEAAVPA